MTAIKFCRKTKGRPRKIAKIIKGIIATESPILTSSCGITNLIVYLDGIETNDYILHHVTGKEYCIEVNNLSKNSIVETEYLRFDSNAEFREFVKFKNNETIEKIIVHPSFQITKTVRYEGDFLVTYKDGRTILYDVKGMLTPVYKIKKRLLKDLHNIEITEIKA